MSSKAFAHRSRRSWLQDRRTWLLCVTLILLGALAPSPSWAKPKLGSNGECLVPVGCDNSIDATCTQLYCRALKASCQGDFSSGECKDIKDLHAAGHCSLLADSDCGSSLPRGLPRNDLETSSGGDVVAVDPEPRGEETDLDSLSVRFSTEHEGGADPGHIVGTIHNRSRRTYDCARVEFKLSTRYDARVAGQKAGPIGTLGTDVRDIQPGSARDFRVRLPSPAGVALGSVGLCPKATEEPAAASARPQILAFRAEPQTIRPGDTVRLFWEVTDAEEVLLFDESGPLPSRIELPNGQLGWPSSMGGAQQETLHEATTFTLVAINQAGRVTRRFEVSLRGKVID